MTAALQLASGLLLAHAAWIYFYVCGTIVETPRIASDAGTLETKSQATSLLRIVVSTASGIAITGFVTFALGLAGLIYPLALAAWVAVLVVIFILLGDSPLRAKFWINRASVVRAGFSPGALVVYILALILSVPALLPETQYDVLFTYYVLAVEWAHRHAIFTDIWTRYPYYPYNWQLIDTWVFEFGADHYVNFISWLCSCLSLLGVYAFIATMCVAARISSSRWILGAIALAGTLSLALSPIFLRYLDTGMVDIAEGLFFLVAVATAAAAYTSTWRPWAVHYALASSFLIGMKTSFIVLFLPLSIAGFLIAAKLWAKPRAAFATVALITVLGAPWYVKNFVQAGDPIAPVLNLAINGVDSKWSRRDMAGQLADLQQKESISTRLLLPFSILEDTENVSFREYGATLVLGLVAVPVFAVFYMTFRRRDKRDDFGRATFIASALLAFAIAYWLTSSHLGRYTLLFYAALAASVPVLGLYAARLGRLPLGGLVAIVAIGALPASSTAWSSLQSFWQERFISAPVAALDRDAYLESNEEGYAEAEYLIRTLAKSSHWSRRVYLVQSQPLDFFFAEHDITAIGDWFGPERFSDLEAAIERDEAVQHLRRFDVGAILVPADSTAIPIEQQRKLFVQLERHGFRRLVMPNSIYSIFVAPGLELS
ncbi:MAG: hypothetical protein WAN59_00815 [Candidatus Baltobacteraceae bacterium]